MNVAFYLDNDDAQYRALARIAVAAVRRHMPDAQVLHLTTRACRQLEGSNGFIVCLAEGGFAYRRGSVNAMVPGACLFLDVDCIVQRPIADDEFHCLADVALPVVSDPQVRYTGGVVFSRSRRFWREWADATRDLDHPDTRTHLLHFQRFIAAWEGDVVSLPESIYERLAVKGSQDYPGAAIVHYRGPRKRFLLDRAG